MGIELGRYIMMGVYAIIFGIILVVVGKKMVNKIKNEKSNVTLKIVLAWIILILGAIFVSAGLLFSTYAAIVTIQAGV